MKSLSLWQPWASLMAAGLKTIETRGWATSYRGPLAIHAAKRRITVEERQLIQDWRNARLISWSWQSEDLHYGVILAVVDLVYCARVENVKPGRHDEAFGNFAPYRWAWITRNLRVLREPIPYRGAQGLFEIPDSILDRAIISPSGGGIA